MEPQGRHREPKGIWEGSRKPEGGQNEANGGANRIFNCFLIEFHYIFNRFSLFFNIFNRISLHVRLIFFKLVSNVPWGVLREPPFTPQDLRGTRSKTRAHPHASNMYYNTALPVPCTHRFIFDPFFVTFSLLFFVSFLGRFFGSF